MSHLVTVKDSNVSVPGRGIVPDETQLLLDQRQVDSMSKGPLFGSGKLQYGGPGMLVKPIANLNTGFAQGAVIAGTPQLMTYAGSVVGLGLLHVAAPVTTGLNITLGVAIGADGTTYVAPKTGCTVNFNVVPEVQTVTPSGTISGGTFTINVLGATTAPIAFGATAANIKTAIDAALAGNTITVGGGPANTTPWTLTFTGYGNVEQIRIDATQLQGTNAALTPAVTTTGVGAPYGLSNWGLIKPLPFKKGQWVVPECVTVGTAFVSGAGLLAVLIQDQQNAYSAYS
jgi:hypothetical protein